MPSHVAADFHVDAFLSGILAGYRTPNLIAGEIFPVVRVAKKSNVFARVDRDNWWRLPSRTSRAEGAIPGQVRFTVSSDTYNAINYELGTDVPFETIDNADTPHAPLQRSAEFLVDQLGLDWEVRVRNTAMDDVGSSTALTGTNAWDDFGGSDPLGDIETGIEAIRDSTGVNPNKACTGQKTWLKLRRHPDIVRAVFPGAGVGGMVSQQQFATLIGVEQFLVGMAIRNTAEEGQANAFTDVWSTNFLLAHVAPTPGIMVPTYGYSFLWEGANIGRSAPGALVVETRRNTQKKAVELQTGYYQDEKIVFNELGYRIDTGITG